jgi:hypothetical protein
MTPPLPEGVYESLRTVGLDAALAELADLTPRFVRIEDADAPHVLARHVAAAVERALRQKTDALISRYLLARSPQSSSNSPTQGKRLRSAS